MTTLKRKLIPAIVLIVAIASAWLIMQNKPDVARKPPARTTQMSVKTYQLMAKDYTITINSYGKVEPRTQGELRSQVSGQVVFVSPHFRAGDYFEKDEILLKIDPRDFEAQVQIAESGLANAHQLLLEEKARSQQALDDWTRLGNSSAPPPLVLRKPQLLAAEANVTSSEAALEQARINLDRAIIRAPYAGRIVAIHADIGQIIASGSSLADIFAVDALEVRLPLRNQDLQFINLPENYRVKSTDTAQSPKVTLVSALPGGESWSGRIVRTESAIDETTQQLHVIARVDDPYGQKAIGRQPLKIGQYVNAKIEGRQLNNVIVIPNESIYQGSYVYIVSNNLLQRKNIEIAWQDNTDALIASGLKAGEQLVTTMLGQVPSGTVVKITDSQ